MNNNIISFDKSKNKIKARQFKLKAQISVYIARNKDSYSIDWSSPDNISFERIYENLKKIFNQLIKEIPTIEYKKEDIYEVEFTLLYFEKDENTIKYICNPSNLSKEKLVEYLWILLNIYELKKKVVL